jgi:hypothetical protein
VTVGNGGMGLRSSHMPLVSYRLIPKTVFWLSFFDWLKINGFRIVGVGVVDDVNVLVFWGLYLNMIVR